MKKLHDPNKQFRIEYIDPEKIRLIVVDSFCGAGGFTQGVEDAVDESGHRVAIVVAGVNHDALAIESHAVNHPETVHFFEDVRDESLPRRIAAVVEAARLKYPNAKVLFHASLECTNFSHAKGGKEKDPDSRSLAESMPMYLDAFNPDYFTIENVREFLDWGPMRPKQGVSEDGYEFCHLVAVTKGKGKKKVVLSFAPHWVPIRERKGEFFDQWRDDIWHRGYAYEHRLHNTADFGVNQSRTRLFGIFYQYEMPVAWPRQSHARDPKSGLAGHGLKKWRPIRECLNLEEKGRSIFRDKPLSDKTYERIFEGLVRHIGNGDRAFLSKYYTGDGMNFSIEEPAHTITNIDHHSLIQCEPFLVQIFAANSKGHNTYPATRASKTITTQDGHAVVTPEAFVMTYHSGSPECRVKSLDDPAQTLTTENRIAGVFCMKYHGHGHNTYPATDPSSTLTLRDRVAVVESQFISMYYSAGGTTRSKHEPAYALTAIPKHRLVSAEFIDRQYGKSKPAGIDDAAGCLTANPHLALVQSQQFLLDQQWAGRTRSLEKPSNTIIARLDKSPTSLVSAEWLLSNIQQNRGKSLDAPSPTLLTGNHHYLMSTHFSNVGRDLEDPSSVITADRQWDYVVSAEHGLCPVIIVYPHDSIPVRKIKAFMAEYGVSDILMRMLMVPELKRIQGFPPYYILKGTIGHQKKFIGNSVPPLYVKKWMEALGEAIDQQANQSVAEEYTYL